jgi:hypothetical protein
MNDIDILNEERKVYFIGPKKKKIELEMLGISKYYQVFIPRFLTFLNFFKKDLELVNFPSGKEWSRKKEIEALRSQLQRLFSHRKVHTYFIKLLKKVGYLKFSKRYFYKYVKPSELIDIFIKVYKFNIDDLKKKVLEMELATLTIDQQSQTFIDNLLKKGTSNQSKSGVGKNGRLKPRFQQLKKSKSHS